jgi:hypothetical protein
VRKVALVSVAIGLCACVAPAARATEPFARVRYGVSFVSFPVGVRNIGMGATGTSDASPLSTGYFNPASLAFCDATTIHGSHEDLITDVNMSDFLVTTPVPFRPDSSSAWRFGGAITYSRLALDIEDRTIFLPGGTVNSYHVADWLLSGTGGVSWSRGVVSLAAGGTAKFIEVAPNDATLWSFDAGLLAAFPIHFEEGMVRPRLGYAILNLDTGGNEGSDEYYVPTEKRAGFGFDLETPLVSLMDRAVPSVRVSLDYDRIDRENNDNLKFSSGFELCFLNAVSFRYGVVDERYTAQGVGLGWDFGRVLFRLDYAHTKPRDERNFAMDLDPDRDALGALVGVRW